MFLACISPKNNSNSLHSRRRADSSLCGVVNVKTSSRVGSGIINVNSKHLEIRRAHVESRFLSRRRSPEVCHLPSLFAFHFYRRWQTDLSLCAAVRNHYSQPESANVFRARDRHSKFKESIAGSSAVVQSIADRSFRWPQEQFSSVAIVPSRYLDKWVVSPKARRVGRSIVRGRRTLCER